MVSGRNQLNGVARIARRSIPTGRPSVVPARALGGPWWGTIAERAELLLGSHKLSFNQSCKQRGGQS
jgi:hypothetical protein